MRQRVITTRSAPRSARGFTLVELLVVIAIVIVLVGLLLAGFGGAFTASRNAMAARQLSSIGDAVTQFENDFGYLPPLLTPTSSGDQVVRPESYAARRVQAELRDNRFASEFSLTVYLMGIGDTNGDGTPDTEEDDGYAGPGIRNPGPDRFWGITPGSSNGLTPNTGRGGYVITTGPSYGPYISLGSNADLIERDEETGLFRLLDPWGQPIRYYNNWITERATSGNSFEKTVELIPVELRTGQAVEGQRNANCVRSNHPWDLDANVMQSSFALVSAGKPEDVDGSGRPIPRFGDVNDLDSTWDPCSLDAEQFNTLRQDLETNVRHFR